MTEVTELVHKDVTTAVILPMYKKVDERMLCKISVILGRQLMLELWKCAKDWINANKPGLIWLTFQKMHFSK